MQSEELKIACMQANAHLGHVSENVEKAYYDARTGIAANGADIIVTP